MGEGSARQLPIIYCFLHKFNIIWPVLRSNCATIVEVGCGQGQPRASKHERGDRVSGSAAEGDRGRGR